MNRYQEKIQSGDVADIVGDRAHPTLGQLWQSRHESVDLIVDRALPYNLSTLVVYFAARMGITPNTVSFASGASAFMAFMFGLLLPASQPLMPIVLIYLVSQLAYVLDCADGQLARATGTASKYGDFLDKSVDIAAFTLIFGGYFGFLYRHLSATGNVAGAESWLLLGFLFLMARTSRFAIWQRIQIEVGEKETKSADKDGPIVLVLKNFMDMQVSLLGLLLYPFAPTLCFLVFAAQAALMAAVYVRYFVRAKKLYGA